MENKKNLPYIPLYTGDWEKDCNVLSLEAEAAWLRIIFKMFNNGKQSSYKISTKALQNLWRVTEENVFCIINELEDNDICGIDKQDRFIIFTSRRYEKENSISEIRREAVSKRKDRTKDIQTTYKTDTKDIQNTEYENESDIESDIEIINYKKKLLLEIHSDNFPEIKPEYIEITKAFQTLIRNNLIEAGASTKTVDLAKGTWIDSIRLMIESDGYSLNDLREVYQFLQKDAFWKQNILSTPKLREKMDKLKLKIKNGNGNTNSREATSWEELAEVISSFGD